MDEMLLSLINQKNHTSILQTQEQCLKNDKLQIRHFTMDFLQLKEGQYSGANILTFMQKYHDCQEIKRIRYSATIVFVEVPKLMDLAPNSYMEL